ncbi:hypothetical protein HanPI659440_Chr17g0682931 [Helianthus annuus]|nr:hypothetical protein HanPI659440_Chr17g0682931 [Helianthus annuus]
MFGTLSGSGQRGQQVKHGSRGSFGSFLVPRFSFGSGQPWSTRVKRGQSWSKLVKLSQLLVNAVNSVNTRLGCISKTRHGWNRRTTWSRVLSGRSFPRSLSLFCFRCATKIPVQSRQL